MMSLDDFLDEGPRPDTTPPVPAIAAKAEDLEAFRKSVEDSAGVSGGLWLSYLFVLFYLGLAAGAVTHADLLMQNPVKLPFLNIELPLLAFFFLAPLILFITHAYMLVNLALLADRVQRFHKELGDQLAADPALQLRAVEIRSVLTRQLPSNIFVQFLGGPNEIRKRALGKALAVILWLTLVGAPIALLLLLQIQFLPYHSPGITWTNRVFFLLDLGLIWWLWGFNILRGADDHLRPRSWGLPVLTSIAGLLTACAIFFGFALATIPGEWQEDHLPYHAASTSLRRWIFPVRFTFGANAIVVGTTRPWSPFSNTLVLPGFDIYEALKIDDPKKVEWKQRLIDLRGRDLRGALLEGAVLTRADLAGAQLQDARLAFAQLQGASLGVAQLQGALFIGAQLEGATLDNAQLQGAHLDFAQLQGASLYFAELDGASLHGAQLQGADLRFAKLQGVTLHLAQLQGATLDYAQLQGADLGSAQLQGATLQSAQLKGVWLGHAFLWRAQLKDTVFENTFDADGQINWSPMMIFGLDAAATPRPWTDATYAKLRQSIERKVPQGRSSALGSLESSLRDRALERVAILDCKRRDDNTLASCDPSDSPPDAVKPWKKMIEAVSIDPNAYAKALTGILGNLLCSGKADRIYVARGVLRSLRFEGRRLEGYDALVKRIARPECPLSMELTDADKHTLGAGPDSGGKPP
jgi:uncharacterized protein YjbI with pentapeptide repeats